MKKKINTFRILPVIAIHRSGPTLELTGGSRSMEVSHEKSRKSPENPEKSRFFPGFSIFSGFSALFPDSRHFFRGFSGFSAFFLDFHVTPFLDLDPPVIWSAVTRRETDCGIIDRNIRVQLCATVHIDQFPAVSYAHEVLGFNIQMHESFGVQHCNDQNAA